jgi:hypothetical protein
VSGRRPPWWDAIGTGASFTLKVERGGRMPLPWTWEILQENGRGSPQCSMRGYPSAEEAWTAGRTALAGLGR